MMYKSCNECPHNGAACPLLRHAEYIRQMICPFLPFRLSPGIDLRPKDGRLPSEWLPDWLTQREANKPKDYNRDDTQDIANRFKPDNN